MGLISRVSSRTYRLPSKMSDSETDTNQESTDQPQNIPPNEFKNWKESYIVELTRLPGKMEDSEIDLLVNKFKPDAAFYFDADEDTKMREARISFNDRKMAIKCTTKLHKSRVNSIYKLCKKPNSVGIQINAKIINLDLKNSEKDFKSAKKSRIIVRNLKFSTSEKKIRNVFGNYGSITDVSMPLNENNKKLGFVFIQYTSRLEAHKAKNAFKKLDKKIDGRIIAVDIALSKDQYKQKLENSTKNDSEDSEMDTDSDHSENESSDNVESENEESESMDTESDVESSQSSFRDSDLEDSPEQLEQHENTKQEHESDLAEQ